MANLYKYCIVNKVIAMKIFLGLFIHNVCMLYSLSIFSSKRAGSLPEAVFDFAPKFEIVWNSKSMLAIYRFSGYVARKREGVSIE